MLPSFINVRTKFQKVKVKGAQSCLTLCDPMDYKVHGILQARILEWVAFPFSRDLSNPGIEPRSPKLHVDSLPAEPQGKPLQTVKDFNTFLRITERTDHKKETEYGEYEQNDQ